MILLNTSYLPSLSWFSYLVSDEKSLIEQSNNFQKQSFRNRTIILTSQGCQNLVIPVIHQGHQKITEIKISYRENWIRQHIRSIETAYRKAPYFEYYWPEIALIIKEKHELLFHLNQLLIDLLCTQIGTEKPSVYSGQESNESIYTDLRDLIHPKINTGIVIPSYIHLFNIQAQLREKLSILDLLFNAGPESMLILSRSTHIL